MKRYIRIFFLIFLPFSVFSQELKTSATFTWTIEDAKQQAQKYNELWNSEMSENEINLLEDRSFPVFPSSFPTPEYDTTGNGITGAEFKISGKNVLSRSAFVKRGKHSEFLFRDENGKEAVYFTILTIHDGVESPNPSGASSRNHPNYFAQGSFNTTTKSTVDWVVIQAADGNAFAIVNERIFDLRVGRVILAAPQIDGSIRFFQTEAKPMNIEELNSYLKDLVAQENIINFFSKEGNI